MADFEVSKTPTVMLVGKTADGEVKTKTFDLQAYKYDTAEVDRLVYHFVKFVDDF